MIFHSVSLDIELNIILGVLYSFILDCGISFQIKLFNMWVWSISKLHWKHISIHLCVQIFLHSIFWFFLVSYEQCFSEFMRMCHLLFQSNIAIASILSDYRVNLVSMNEIWLLFLIVFLLLISSIFFKLYFSFPRNWWFSEFVRMCHLLF